MKYTPGPWIIGRPGPNGCYTVGTAKGLMVAMVAHSINYKEQAEAAKANSKLIAAAPELFDLVQFFVDNFGGPRCLENRDKYQEAVRLLNELKGETK